MTRRGTQTSPVQLVRQGFALHQEGDLSGAERLYRRALKRDKRNADALYLLGSLQVQEGKPAQAERTLLAALKAQPGRPEAQFNLARVYMQTDRHGDAEPLLMAALEKDPESISVLGSLGVVRLTLGDFKGATDALERAVRVAPESEEAWCDLGMAYSQGDQEPAAAEAFDTALSLKPGFARARHNRGHLRLRNKQFAEGWTDYEFRRSDAQAGFETRPHAMPQWEGDSLTGRTLLVWGEQGLGDQILQASMIPDLMPQTQALVLECEPRLQPLLARSFAGAKVVAASDRPHPDIALSNPDIQCAGGSLGRYLRTDESTFPDCGAYLTVDSQRAAELRKAVQEQCGDDPVIGLSWQSHRVSLGPFKSTNLADDWEPILKSKSGAAFVSLQYGTINTQLEEVKRQHGVNVHKIPNLDVSRDIDGLAALISGLDLVITTSNTTAHLAGALGVPTWVLVPRGPARLWYWFDGETESLWYPSARLFWQDTAGDWAPVMSRIADALTALPWGATRR